MSFDLISLPLSEIATFKYGKTIRKQDIEDAGLYPVHSGYTTVGYLPSYMYEEPQLMIVCRGAGGTGDIKMSPPKVSITNLAIVITCDESKVCKDYLYWVLKLADTYSLRTGSAQPQITINSLDSFNVVIHQDLSIQRSIADFLDKLDLKIGVNSQTNQTLESIVQAIFKSWFVDFDPVKAKMNGEQPEAMDAATASLFPEKLVESELGLIPDGWDASSMGEHFNITMGQSPKGETYNEDGEGIAFFQGRRDFGFRYPDVRVYTTDPKRHAKAGDTLISVRAPVGDKNMAAINCCIGRGVAAIKHKSQSRSFTYAFVSHIEKKLSDSGSSGTVFSSINQNELKKVSFIAPPQDLIEAFHKLVDPIDQKIEVLSEEIKSLSAMRDTLLPKLLSGEIELEVR
ncbi:Type I restriction-modification system, specificity subunit S [Vibrio harveyi]|uniref:restriction endonuclease subunit S n=1 Tax=Vibrio harveyi TaxID=669 RepID=UPI001EFE6936|nr:restriction endonuclease subunit S [Vibrio harveyi]MCG9232808.1 restriction endonuclease subunit S [Vibrio harveyi]MCG9588582.1 restriction endonuclease subunit S [Vibrio harveyi]CAH1229274.1 Type I restriction-modification system, specificity subunit S [Vibrio harveyi]CAH1577943.1 Type I restriction-modification system, specificity subunit S [Vibrio harveyi]CAH1586995.1 Type I restriction-modification system, specificity subunit S [Vibrio harveyi]